MLLRPLRSCDRSALPARRAARSKPQCGGGESEPAVCAGFPGVLLTLDQRLTDKQFDRQERARTLL
jgi:hypothetical protein